MPSGTWFEEDDATPAAALVFDDLVAGMESDERIVHLWNAKGATSGEPLRNLRLVILARNAGDATPLVSTGHVFLSQRWFRVHLLEGAGEVLAVETELVALGDGAYLVCPDVPFNSALYVAVSVRVPGTFEGSVDVEAKLQVVNDNALPLGSGHSEFRADGVLLGLGDGAFSGLFVGGEVTAAGTPDNTVAVAYAGGVDAGVPYGVAAAVETLNNLDSASAALASGQEYLFLVSVSAAGRAITKGLKAAIGSAARPTVPPGEQPLAFARRQFDGIINSIEIEDVRSFARYRWSDSALIGTVSAGQALVDNAWAMTSTPQSTEALPDDSTTTAWLGRTGALSIGTTAPRPRSLPLYEVDTVGGVVTAVHDLRGFVGAAPTPITLRLGAVLAEDLVSPVALVTGNRPLLLDPEFAAAVALDDTGDTLTAGESRIDVEYDPDGSGWESVFGDGEMPSVPFDAVTVRACSPTTCVIPAGSRIRARVDAIPTGTAAPSGATVILLGWSR